MINDNKIILKLNKLDIQNIMKSLQYLIINGEINNEYKKELKATYIHILKVVKK